MIPFLFLLLALLPVRLQTVTVPFGRAAWVPDGGDARWLLPQETAGLEANVHYLRAPKPGESRARWLAAAKRLRAAARAGEAPRAVRVDFRGVRAWTRLRPETARRLALRPGERVAVSFEARLVSGNPEVGFALDFHDLRTGAWQGWSTIFATVKIPAGGGWHRLRADLTLSDIPPGDWASLIVGQDATHDPAPGAWEMRGLTLELPVTPVRQQAARELAKAVTAAKGLDRSLYDRPDLRWSAGNFACYFTFMYDRRFYDPAAGGYRADAFLDELQREFGGVDSVVLWHAYPRIGVDPRSQFDFYRDMPAGLTGLRRVVDTLHRRGVKAFINYNPWDTGTRREGVSDAASLGRIVKAIGADGIFLDTMVEAPPDLRPTVDAHRRGVVFEPEGSPPTEQLSACSASWAQGFAAWPEPGVLRHKWVEPRHMQHQIRRWDRSHAEEIEAAFFNGSGMLLWENIFGSWNPWSAADRALWRQAVSLVRAFAPELASETWEPFYPTLAPGIYANRWTGRGVALYLLVNRADGASPSQVLRLPPNDRGGRVFDLWRGVEVKARSDGAVRLPLERLGAVAVARDAAAVKRIQAVLRNRPGVRNSPPSGSPAADPWTVAKPHDPKPVARTDPAGTAPPGMVFVPGGAVRMKISHERRECGCYPDPGTLPDRRGYFTYGTPFNETISHDYAETVQPFYMDETPVTNDAFASFLKASGYRPKEPRNFLKHWPGGKYPETLRDHPVVWVDLEDARAYARWAGKRLPIEAEWQRAAQGDDGRKWPWGDTFDPARCNGSGPGTTPVRAHPQGRSPNGCYDMAGNIWQWTESERDDGHTRYVMLRGGSWFDAKGSGWYVHGGAQPLDYHAKFLLFYPGLDRCATIGFRCVKDAAPR